MGLGEWGYDGEKYYRNVEIMEIENLYAQNGKSFVQVLDEQEAKAALSREYGFEFNTIRIEGKCWYSATDWNYFRFRVGCWKYEVKDFGALKVVD